MSRTPYIAAGTRKDVEAAPVDTFIVCANCLEQSLVDDDVDPTCWAVAHNQSKPHHARYRLERITRFSLPGASPRAPYPAPVPMS